MNRLNSFYELTFTNLFVSTYPKGAKSGDIMFTIPKGATNVRILEMGKSYNFLSKYNVKLLKKRTSKLPVRKKSLNYTRKHMLK